MSILGCTDRGLGRYQLTLDHNPSVTATDGLQGSTAVNILDDTEWYKLDDGETTNWTQLGVEVNTNIQNVYNGLLSGTGVDDVGDALQILDNLNISDVGGGVAGGVFITQHNQGQPYSEVTTTSWTTLCAIPFEGSSNYPIAECWAVVSLSLSGEGAVRVQDITNNQTIVQINWTDSTEHIEIGALSNVPEDIAVLEIQLRKVTGGKPRLWSLQLR